MKIRHVFCAVLVFGCSGASALAQTARPSTGASPQAVEQLQQLASERTQLQADNAKLKQQLDEANRKLKGLQADKDSIARKTQGSAAAIARLTASNETLSQNLAQQRTRMEELVAKFRETLQTLKGVESERTSVTGRLDARNREFDTCVEKNLALYRINVEVLDRLERQGFWSSVAKAEPFTRLKRTEIENLVDEYRDHAKDQEVAGPAKPPSGG